MLRNLLVPAILIGALAFPFFVPLDQLGLGRGPAANNLLPPTAASIANVNFSPGAGQSIQSPFRTAAAGLPAARNATPQSAFQTVATSQNNPSFTTGGFSAPATGNFPTAVDASWAGPIYDENGNLIGVVPGPSGNLGAYPSGSGIRPDFAAAQTLTLPGSSAGPDFSAEPLQFTPVMNFDEIFNYGATSAWLQSRWDRVSNAPVADGLRGQRVALVTGTNSWDLHGSLTYYFDRFQRCRRITFRGWTGDASRLINFLQTKHNFKQQPTRSAGFYLAKSWRKLLGGLLMRNPTVTYAENRVQRMGVLLEMNDPRGKFQLSNDFRTLVDGDQQ